MKGQNRPAVSLFALLAIMILTSALLCGCYQNNSQNTTQTPIGDSANGQKVEETGITDPLTGRKVQKVVPLVAVMLSPPVHKYYERTVETNTAHFSPGREVEPLISISLNGDKILLVHQKKEIKRFLLVRWCCKSY